MLTKGYSRRFIPATPEIPPRPSYTVCQPTPGPGHYERVCSRIDISAVEGGAVQLPPGARMVVIYGDEIDPLTGRHVVVDVYWEVCVSRWVSDGPDGDTVCTTYPDEPGHAATPARWEMSAWLEWNSGANSVPEQEGDCEVVFPMGAVIGEVVGLTPDRNGVHDFARLTHAFYFHQTTTGQLRYRVMEAGVGRTADAPYTSGDEFRIRRSGTGVTYWHNGQRVHGSIVPSIGTLSVGVALYASGDWIVGGPGGGPGPGPDPEPTPFIPALAVAHANSSGVGSWFSVYPFSNTNGFVIKYADPATAPPGIQSNKPAFHPDGDALVFVCNAAYVYGYKWSNNGFGDYYASPSPAPLNSMRDAEFRPQGDYLAVVGDSGGTGRRMYLYPWSKETGFGVAPALFGPGGNNNGVAWSPSGNVLAISSANSPRLFCRPFDPITGTTGADYAAPGTIPTGTGNDVAFHPDGTAVAIAHATTPFVSAYPWNDSTGFGAKYANPATLPVSTGRSVSFHPSGNALAVGHDGGTPWISVYPFDAVTGFGTKYANPATVPTNLVMDVAFSPDGEVIAMAHSGSPYVAAYPFSIASGFGVKYPNPFTLPSGQTQGVAWRPLPVEE